MAKKKRKSMPSLSRRGQEKMSRICRQFDVSILFYLILVLLCVAVGACGEYDLGKPSLNGFALWFLLVPAYLPLELCGAIRWIFGFEWNFTDYEALLLGGCDIVLALAVWGAVRWWAVRRRSIEFVRNARLFVLIFVFWGIFQLGCFAALWMWSRGGFTSLHHHLRRVETPAADCRQTGN